MRAGPPAPLVPLPQPLPRDAPGRAGATRAGARRDAQRPCGRVVQGERPAGGRDRVRRRSGRPRRARLTRHCVRLPVLPGRPRNDGRALAGAVRRRGHAAQALSRHRRLRRLGARAAGPARRGGAVGARRRELPVRGTHARREPVRGLGRHRPCAPLQERRRADAADAELAVSLPDGDQPVARGRHLMQGVATLHSGESETAPRSSSGTPQRRPPHGGAVWAGIVVSLAAGAAGARARRARRRGGGAGAGTGLRGRHVRRRSTS